MASPSVGRRRRWALIGSYASLGLFAVIFLLPPYYMLVTSFKTPHEIQTMPGFPLLINEGATLEHYRRLFLETPFFTFLREHGARDDAGRDDLDGDQPAGGVRARPGCASRAPAGSRPASS